MRTVYRLEKMEMSQIRKGDVFIMTEKDGRLVWHEHEFIFEALCNASQNPHNPDEWGTNVKLKDRYSYDPDEIDDFQKRTGGFR